MAFIPTEHSHNRYNPLNGQWVLVCPNRTKRPWTGHEEQPQKFNLPEHDPTNPLAPGASRADGTRNEEYTSTYVFTNDFPALLENVPAPPESDDPLFQAGPACGTCRVVCFHPKQNKTIAIMTPKEIRTVVDEWVRQFKELSSKYIWVQIFENKGAAMGCSNPHPHGQIWACSFLPNEPRIKDNYLRVYYQENKRTLLDDYARKEIVKKERVVIDNPDWLVVVPYWAIWPFETMVIARNDNKRICDLTNEQMNSLSIVIKELTTKYDNLFKCSFPYSMGWHGAPTGSLAETDNSHWTLHAVYYPPLLRSATVRKFTVAFEMLCQPQRDITPEQAAERLRNIDGRKHYVENTSD